MADNKATTLHPPQSLKSQPFTGLHLVKGATYRALAEMHAGFEKVIHELGTLSRTSFLRSDALTAIYEQLWQIRAQAFREVLSTLGQRETANAAHYERLCSEHGGSIQPPATLPANGS
jgi:hypothetical protein